MGANDRVNHYPPLSQRAGHVAKNEEERHAYRMRDLIHKKWLARRDAFAAGNEAALDTAEHDLIEYFHRTGALRSLIRCAVSNPSDTTGREFLRVLKDMIADKASAEAKIELEPPPSRQPLGESTVAALNAAAQAAAGLEKW